jgi:hypothetical protein
MVVPAEIAESVLDGMRFETVQLNDGVVGRISDVAIAGSTVRGDLGLIS